MYMVSEITREVCYVTSSHFKHHDFVTTFYWATEDRKYMVVVVHMGTRTEIVHIGLEIKDHFTMLQSYKVGTQNQQQSN